MPASLSAPARSAAASYFPDWSATLPADARAHGPSEIDAEIRTGRGPALRPASPAAETAGDGTAPCRETMPNSPTPEEKAWPAWLAVAPAFASEESPMVQAEKAAS